MRITRLQRPRLPPLSRPRHRARARADGRPRTQRGRQDDDPARPRAGAHPPGDQHGRRPRGAPTVGRAAEARSVIPIEFEQDDEDGRKAGTLEKSFRGAKGTVRLEFDGETITDPTLADQVLAELTGIPTEAFFRSTASVRHHELADLARDEAALRDRLQASISGADRGTSRARKKLDKALHELTTRGDKNPGRLKVAEEAVEQAAGRRRRRASSRSPSSSAIATRCPARASAGRDAEAALAERRALLEKARQAERLIAERTAAPRSATSGTARRSRSTRRSRRSRRPIRRQPRCPSSAHAVERLRALDGRIRELRALLSDEVERRRSTSRPEPTWRPLSRAPSPSSSSACSSPALARAGRDARGRRSRASLVQRRRRRSSRSIGLILARVALWLRRSDRRAGPAARRRDRPAPPRPVARSSTSSRTPSRRSQAQLAALGLTGPRRGRGAAHARGGPRRPRSTG